MKMPFIFASLLLVSATVAQSQTESLNRGVIFGTVTAQDGTPAKGLILNVEPLGVVLATVLPWTKTNDAGSFQFENLPFGRYTVFAQDKAQGYSSSSTGTRGQGNGAEVELTSQHPQAEFNLLLPPKAGFLYLNLWNQRTGVRISGGEVTIMLAENPERVILGASFYSSNPVLVPSNKSLLLHVKSWGFSEWDQSAGKGKLIWIAPGDRLTLDVQLDATDPLRDRIPDPDSKKYLGIHDGRDWKNPYLIVRPDGIVVSGPDGNGNPIPVASVPAALERLPDTAWPYGLVVAVQDDGIVASESERSRIEANRTLLLEILNQLGVIVGLWPSA
jgi:hypothetical protein